MQQIQIHADPRICSGCSVNADGPGVSGTLHWRLSKINYGQLCTGLNNIVSSKSTVITAWSWNPC